jgi:hypothetical protein
MDYSEYVRLNIFKNKQMKQNKANSVAFGPQAKYTDWTTVAGLRILVPTLADRRASRGQRDGSPLPLLWGFLDRSR